MTAANGLRDASGLPDASSWAMDPGLAYLNHGSFGATPVRVLRQQQAWRDAMERNPVGFLAYQLPELLDAVRKRVATFLGADEEGVVFVDNATSGTQTVIAQMRLAPGDEVVATDHSYPAVLIQLRRAVESAGAVLTIAPVALPATGRESVAQSVLSQVTARTRLVVIDHVASCSGMVFPVEEIASECRQLGVPILVDGAHAAGMLPVNVGELGADFWVGNMHKWVSAPKASAALYAAPQWRDTLRPLVASHGLFDGYRPSFDWTGTQDPTALLSVPAALDFFAEAGWQAVRQHNNELARQGADLVAESLGTGHGRDADGLAASMRVVRVPLQLTETQARALERSLLADHGVVVPVTMHGSSHWLRVSAQLYNTLRDYERLADAMTTVTG
jgi:isopenicillin-N epimerase